MKQYKYQYSLTLESVRPDYVFIETSPNERLYGEQVSKSIVARMCGWLFIEVRKGRWQKRFFDLKDKKLFYSKDHKCVEEVMLCSLDHYDVYTLTMKARAKAPTNFCFAIKSNELSRSFEDPSCYIYFLCVDNVEKMRDWVLAIRNSRVSFRIKHKDKDDI